MEGKNNKGHFTPGHNFGSKRKGRTFEKPMQAKLKEVITGYITAGDFEADLKAMQPIERARAVVSVIPFVLPKKQQLSIQELSNEAAEDILTQLLN